MIEAQVANSLFREIESSHRAKLSEARKPAATGRQDTNHIKIIVLFGAGFSRPGILAGPKTHYGPPVLTRDPPETQCVDLNWEMKERN